MFYNGFIDCAVASTKVHLGDPLFNAKEIVNALNKLNQEEVSIVAFPELSLTGTSLNDLLFQNDFYFDAMDALKYVLDNNNYLGIAIIGGLLQYDSYLYNVAYIIQSDEILGIVPKEKLSLNEKKYFTSGKQMNLDGTIDVDLFDFTVPFGRVIFNNNDLLKFAITIGEQNPKKYFSNGANIVFNLNTIIKDIQSDERSCALAKADSIKQRSVLFVNSIGQSDSTSEVVFSNLKCCYSDGEELIHSNSYSFEEELKVARIDLSKIEYQKKIHNLGKKNDINFVDIVFDEIEPSKEIKYGINKTPFVPTKKQDLENIINIQATSMARRLDYIGCKKVVIGVSGGLDSTVALLSLVHMCDLYQMDRKNIIGVRLPTSNNSNTTYQNSIELMEKLGIDSREINISDGAIQNLKQIGHTLEQKDIAYENAQARYRTMTLMNLANLEGGLVCGTGDMSEIALGWCTFNGDHMAMYGLNAGLPKTTIKAVTAYYKTIYPEVASILDSILDTPISPELAGSNQHTEDIIGKYEINDFILYRYLVCGDEFIRINDLLISDFGLDEKSASDYVNNFFKRFFSQQYKRLTMPEGVKVFDLSLSPRSGVKFNGDIYFQAK